MPEATQTGSPSWAARVRAHVLTPGFALQIMLVSSSLGDRDQSLFISTDEGATFQKQLVPFSVETLIFHPQEEDKALAYTKESKVSGRRGCGAGSPGLGRWTPPRLRPEPRLAAVWAAADGTPRGTASGRR